MNLLISLALIFSVQAFTAEESDFNYDVESSSEESSKPSTETHARESKCDELSFKDFKIKQDVDAPNVHLDLSEKGKHVGSYEPGIDGPGNKCLKLKEFELDGLMLLEVCHGLTGTSVQVERHSVIVLRQDGKKLRQLAELEIKYVEREGDAVRVVNDKTYKTKKKDGKAILVLKDKATKKETEHFFGL